MYISDLHIHSRFSRATSHDLTPEQLDFQAGRKGIRLLGTGDFTHPAWRKELREKLIPAEGGFYCLKDEYGLQPQKISEKDRTRFVVSGEISSIYKQGGKVRKVHSLLILPSLEAAEKLSLKLETIGNIHSDGRPILGLSCHDLLEIMLEICPEGIYVPAHIWTPHFSMFGALSGFDTVEECFGDLSSYIHAVETGLSSDPPMNWRISALDRFQLISNSDAHSPGKLGREANLFSGEFSYEGLKTAIETGRGLEKTIEFFPEEGKYHFDGHRKCHICMSPVEAEDLNGICPVCQKKMTMGVSHRIEQLADRSEDYRPFDRKPFESLVPLPEVIGASLGRSSAGKRVQEEYQRMLEKLGTEFEILREIPIEDIRHQAGYLVSEGVRRLREGKVIRHPGFDGEYGTIQLFEPDEIKNTEVQISFAGLLNMPEKTADYLEKNLDKLLEKGTKQTFTDLKKEKKQEIFCLNTEQKKAAESMERSIAVIAGPGTGKTRTLISRIKNLVEVRRVKAGTITAVTFTNEAAKELKERLKKEMPRKRTSVLIQTGTFHSICMALLKYAGVEVTVADPEEVLEIAKTVMEENHLKMSVSDFLKAVSAEKTRRIRPLELFSLENSDSFLNEEANEENAFLRYEEVLSDKNLMDFDDLLIEALCLLKEDDEAARQFCSHFQYLMIDEFQDINQLQYSLICEWTKYGKELFVIGDKDQSICNKVDSEQDYFLQLIRDFPDTKVIRLKENYRSSEAVIETACSMISHNQGEKRVMNPQKRGGIPVRIVNTSDVREEYIAAAKEINRMVGGIDIAGVEDRDIEIGKEARNFSDIGVLCRTNKQIEIMEEHLRAEGIPYIVRGRGSFLEEKPVREAIEFFKTIDPIMQKKKPSDLIKKWMENRQLEEEDSLKKLMSMAAFYKSMKEFLETLLYGQEGDLKRCGGKNHRADAVSLMTIHASKGLEFSAVIMLGAGKISIPLSFSEKENRAEMKEEERRLLYVGMTRAEEELILLTSGENSELLEELSEKWIKKENYARF